MSLAHIPLSLKELPQWVNAWGSSKIPMQSTIKKGASTVDSSTWNTFEVAKEAIESGLYDHLGFVFNNNGIVGIDIDKWELADEIIEKFESYTEKSISGRGVHILVKGKLPFTGKNNNGVEVYQSRRYFLMTGDVIGERYEIVENQEAIDWLVDKYFKDEALVGGRGSGGRIYNVEYTAPTGGKISFTPTYPPIPTGMRNISLTSLAGQLHNQGYALGHIYTELLKCNQVACNPPLKQYEIENIVKSVSRYSRRG